MIEKFETGENGEVEAITFSHKTNPAEWINIIYHLLNIVEEDNSGDGTERSYLLELVYSMLPTAEQCKRLYYKPETTDNDSK
jgi:hypothetical protein